MTKTCKELFAGFDCSIIGNPDEPIEGIAYRSDRVKPGDAFCCIVGLTSDGHSYAQDAIDRGARVLVVERKIYLADASDVTEVVVSDSRKAMAHLAASFYNWPSDDFSLVGITGTNGKTTTTYLVEHLADCLGLRTGLIGTTGTEICGQHYPSEHTTPESPDLQKLFAQMRDEKCAVVAMEVSSHALDLKRVWDTNFAVTAFTNLTQDHLDYHKTFESYFDAKAKLFSSNYPAKRVINIDSEWGKKLLQRCVSQHDEVITTGFDKAALIHPTHIEYSHDSTTVTLVARGKTHTFTYPLVGRFNVENIMTAFGIGLQLGWSSESIVQGLMSAPSIPGRIQRVKTEHDGDIAVYVDYAHTPDALAKAISCVKALTDNNALVVFGCGGDRDSSKRPLMGAAALAADYAIVTSDNPRTEDPIAIIDDIVEGMGAGADHYCVEPDRKAAIALALEKACPGDVVLIAGKGHEDYQILGTEKIHFSDFEVAAAELERLFG